jgi:hypothetical protein
MSYWYAVSISVANGGQLVPVFLTGPRQASGHSEAIN